MIHAKFWRPFTSQTSHQHVLVIIVIGKSTKERDQLIAIFIATDCRFTIFCRLGCTNIPRAKYISREIHSIHLAALSFKILIAISHQSRELMLSYRLKIICCQFQSPIHTAGCPFGYFSVFIFNSGSKIVESIPFVPHGVISLHGRHRTQIQPFNGWKSNFPTR